MEFNVITVDTECFIQWKRCLFAQARLLRKVNQFLSKIRRVDIQNSSYLADEIKKAEDMLFTKAQLDVWKKEMVKLKIEGVVDYGSSLISYSPYLDPKGVMRSRGRIDNADVSDEIKRKIILPSKHNVTVMLIKMYHEKFLHQNDETVISELRQRFIIPRIRQIFKSVRAKCLRFKITKVKPRPPMMAELPAARLAAYVRPFSYVGLDYFGPLEVIIGRRVEKRWAALFTCMTVRAIHIELASSLSTSSCILCLRNFMNRRGEPLEIFCDNGTNFRGAAAELLRELKKLDYKAPQSAYPGIKWTFNPPSSPHMGGVWERLVRSVKSNIMEVLPSRRPTEEVLRSFLIEVEFIVNSRPLTHIPVDPMDRDPLTPNHFILGSSNDVRAVDGVPRADGDMLLNTWRKSRALANDFWHRWVVEYLPDLCRRTKWFVPVEPLKVGDLVVVVDSRNQFGKWPKAIVEEVFTGRDGQTRSARIRTSAGEYVRPTVKLAKLDVANDDVRSLKPEDSNTGVQDVGDSSNRTGRKLIHRSSFDIIERN